MHLDTGPRRILFLLPAVALTSMAAGAGWGIRGQYGHESGAMIAGSLASLTLVMLFVPLASSLTAARAAAMMTVAIGFGGSMTYGQTIGLTHDHQLLGNWEALRWGLIGLFIKGGIWIGFGGAFLGMGLGGVRYRPREMLGLMLGMIGLMFLGIWLINSPFDPSSKTLPSLYFSDNWYFEPDSDLQPRREKWGGLLVALMGLIAYVRLVRGDRLAARMALVGIIAGGLGFAGGQAIQASHAWNPELYTAGALAWAHGFTKYFNWWNIMEITFGTIWGGGMALGLWLNRDLISIEPSIRVENTNDEVTLSPTVEVLLCAAHVSLLLASEFAVLSGPAAVLKLYTAFGFVMAVLPLMGIVGGRFWPYLMLLPVVMAPIAGKTLRSLSYATDQVSCGPGWWMFIAVPLAITLVVVTWLIYRSKSQQRAHRFTAVALVVVGWLFFALNTAVFNYAWPWKEWTGRTPSQLIFSLSMIVLTAAAVVSWLKPAGFRVRP